MNTPPDDFLYTAAEIAIGYVTVTAILIGLRQLRAGPLSRFQFYIVRNTIELGFGLLLLSMLPMAIRIAGASDYVWQVSSPVFGIFMILWACVVVRRRRLAAPETPLGKAPLAIFALFPFFPLGVMLIANSAFGYSGLYVAGIFWTLLASTFTLARVLPLFFAGSEEQ